MRYYDQVQTAQRTERLPELIDGFYPLLQVLKVEEYQGSVENGSKVFYRAKILVLESAPGLSPAGSVTAMLQQLNGKFPSIAQACVAEFVSACLGINPADKARRQTEVTPVVVAGTTLPANPLAGSIIAGSTKLGKDRGPGKDRIPNWTWQPVLDPATGRPMHRPVDPRYLVTEGSAPSASAPAASPPYAGAPGYAPAGAPTQQGYVPQGAPAPAPQGAPAPGPAFPPPGWLPHHGQFYKPGMTTCMTEAQVRAEMAAGRA